MTENIINKNHIIPKGWSLKWKMIILMSVLMMMIVAILTVIQTSYQTELIESELEKRIDLRKEKLIHHGELTIKNLVLQVENNLAAHNYSGVVAMIELIVNKNDEIKYAVFLDSSGIILVHTQERALVQTKLPEENSMSVFGTEKLIVKEYQEGKEDVAQIAVPIQISTKPGGELRLIYTLKYIDEEIASSRKKIKVERNRILYRAILISLTFIFICAVFVYFLASKLLTPLTHLTYMAGKLSAGDFSAPEDYKSDSSDEVGVLSDAFGKMNKDLKKTYEYLKKEIDERKRIGEMLSAREETVRVLMNAPTDSAMLVDTEGIILALNNQAAQRFNKTADELTGKCIYEFFNSESVTYRKTLLEEVVASKKIVPFEDTQSKRIFEGNLFPIFDSDQEVSSVAIYEKDATEMRLLHAQIIRSERMAATGQLAASVAHEINSPLQGIASLLGFIKKTRKRDIELIDNIELVNTAFDNIRNTINTLLDLNRPGKEIKQPINVNTTIEGTTALLRSFLKKNRIKIKLALSEKIPTIKASPQQLGQVFINLINNSVEAISENTMPKQADDRFLGKEEISISTVNDNGNIIIKVADTGPGISEKDQDKVFHPLFTKKKKMGMGVGLSICRSIIDGHSGTIEARNAEDGGCVFTITLPVK